MGADNSAANLAAQQKAERERALTKGKAAIDEQFAKFTPAFYTQRKKDFLSYALPQIARQERAQQNALGYSLARRGVNNSSQALSASRDLAEVSNQNRRQAADQGQSIASALEANVASQRNNLYGTLAATLDPSMAATSALNTAQSLQAPSSFVPIGNLFSDWSQNYLAKVNKTTYDTATQEIPKLNFAKV